MTSPDPTIANLLLVALTLLDQCSDLLQKLDGDSSKMTYETAALPGSTIGKHLRHLTDHFALLCSSTQQCMSDPETQLSYDTRIRNGPAEVDAAAAEQGLAQLKATLRECAERQWTSDQPVKLHAVTPFEVTTKSSVGRELWFCSLHAVHHMAVIRVLATDLNIFLPKEFGVAPSTLLHQQKL